ncbi:MAG: zinc ABC transporter substrate-binding protein [Firmicutes bacterium]|nr:zinc ABC transporter substrate-binding protein [Bacillota bacterium]
MKKIIAVIEAAALLIGSLASCGTGGKTPSGSGKPHIVTTIFPEYDWVINILGDDPAGADVTMLLDNGVDLHSFQPTAADILSIATCDMFIYVGGESDKWVEDALKKSTNKDMVIIDLLEVLGDAAKEEEMTEGMQEEEHEHEHEDEGPEYDEHVWLSLKNAAVLTESISQAIQKLDPANAEIYRKNTAAYIEKLDALDAQYKSAADSARFKTLLFGDRFPFRYLTDDYGLKYYAAFSGCSAETEASFETISFLAQKMDELSLPAVMTIEKTDHRIAETIVRSTTAKDQKILTLDSMQSVTAKDAAGGATYLSIMENNLSVLKDALN